MHFSIHLSRDVCQRCQRSCSPAVSWTLYNLSSLEVKPSCNLSRIKLMEYPVLKIPTRIIESNSWPCTGHPNTTTLCLTAFCKCSWSSGSLGLWPFPGEPVQCPTTLWGKKYMNQGLLLRPPWSERSTSKPPSASALLINCFPSASHPPAYAPCSTPGGYLFPLQPFKDLWTFRLARSFILLFVLVEGRLVPLLNDTLFAKGMAGQYTD